MYDTILEIVGYVASAIVLVSFFMASVVKLRLYNLIGGAIFTVYAFLTRTYPTAAMNLCIVLVDIYYLLKLSRRNARYTILPTRADDPYLEAFLAFFRSDIRQVCPNLEETLAHADTICLTYCDMSPAGLLLGKQLDEKTLQLLLEYHTPAHRDSYTSRALYTNLQSRGIGKLVWSEVSQCGRKRLKKLGYSPQAGQWVMEL